MSARPSSARIAPGDLREVGPWVSGFARLAGRVSGTEPPAVFLTLGRNRRLFWGWLFFAGRLMPGGRLPRRDTELLMLVGHYEMLATTLTVLRVQPDAAARGSARR